MDDGKFENGRKIGSVKAAINMYGEKLLQGATTYKRPQMDPTQRQLSMARDLHLARKNINQIKEEGRAAESVKAQAKQELLTAMKMVKELASKIEESNFKAKEQKKALHTVSKSAMDDHEYGEIKRELDMVKRELSKLKLDVARAMEEKSIAEKQSETLVCRMRSNFTSIEALRKEIEEVNEEQVLVELAQIEARKELAAIEAQRREEASKSAIAMEERREKMNTVLKEIAHIKELEAQLGITNSDIEVMKELKLIKEMDQERVENHPTSGRSDLELIHEELEALKKELASINEGGFQVMASMDVIRNELTDVMKEKDQMNKSEEEAKKTIKDLNLKLLRAKNKLEAVSMSEENAKSILSSLEPSLDKLKSEADVAKKEREIMTEERSNIKEEMRRIESQIDPNEERLQSVMQELEATRLSETVALDRLKAFTENTMRARASGSQHQSRITISRFEYEYLTSSAAIAQEIADKKVAAAQAWTQALKASEKEKKMKIELAEKEAEELKSKKEQQTNNKYQKRLVAEEREKNAEDEIFLEMEEAKEGNLTPARRAKIRKSVTLASRPTTRSSSFMMKKRRKELLKIAKYFASEQIGTGIGSEDQIS